MMFQASTIMEPIQYEKASKTHNAPCAYTRCGRNGHQEAGFVDTSAILGTANMFPPDVTGKA